MPHRLLHLLARSTSFTPASLPNLALWLDPNPGTGQGTTAGKAAGFTAANSQYLSAADDPSLRSNGGDFWVAAWVKLASLPSSGANIVAKAATSGSSIDYLLQYNFGVNKFRFAVYNGTTVSVSDNTTGTPSTSAWYFLLAWYDAANQTINIRPNNGTLTSNSATGTIGTSNPQAFAIGANAVPGGYFDGAIDSVMFGKAPPGGIASVISAISSTLYNNGVALNPSDISTAQRAAWGGVSAWALDEASGTRADAWGGNNLTSNNSVGQTTGNSVVPTTFTYGCFKDGAASFNGSGYLLSAANTQLGIRSTGFSFVGWVYTGNSSTTEMIYSNGFSNGLVEIFYTGGNTLTFRIGTSSSYVDTTVAPSPANQWVFVAATYDPGTDTARVSTNNSASASGTVSSSGMVYAVSASTAIGARYDGTITWSGSIDSVGVYSRPLSAAEITTLYNGGAGLNYADIPTSLKTGLTSWYNLDETTGTRYDSHGSNNLTMNGTVGWNAGIASSLCGNGDPVSKWVAKTGHIFTPLSLSARPTYSVVSGKPYLTSDQVDDALYYTGNLGTIQPDPCTVFIVGKDLGNTNFGRIAGFGQTKSFYSTGNLWGFYQDPTFDAPTFAASNNNTICTWRLDKTTAYSPRFNGVTSGGTARPGGDATANFGIFANGQTTSPQEYGKFQAQEFIVYNRILSLTEIAQVEKYLNAKYAVY